VPGKDAWSRASVLAALLAMATASGRTQSRPGPGTACADELERQRQAWRAVPPALTQPAIAPGDSLRHWPTDAPGVWLVERTGGDVTTLMRVSANGLERVTWSGDCTPAREDRPRAAATAPSFSDGDLIELLGRGSRGVLYLWSPHMPLSVDGYAEIAAAARGRGLVVEPLLDPASDRAFASTVMRDRRLPANARRVADSVELQFRELPLHAPAVQVFSGGRLVGPVLRGFRTADEYGAFLDRVLSRP
jgi:hypothetical protein